MLAVVFLLVLKGVVEASVASDVGGTVKKAGAAVSGKAQKAVMGVSDFAKFPDKSKQPQTTFTWEEMAQYDGKGNHSLYLVFDNNVYDVTTFVDIHPGGPGPLKHFAGRDASKAMREAGMPTQVFDVFLHRFKIGCVEDAKDSS